MTNTQEIKHSKELRSLGMPWQMTLVLDAIRKDKTKTQSDKTLFQASADNAKEYSFCLQKVRENTVQMIKEFKEDPLLPPEAIENFRTEIQKNPQILVNPENSPVTLILSIKQITPENEEPLLEEILKVECKDEAEFVIQFTNVGRVIANMGIVYTEQIREYTKDSEQTMMEVTKKTNANKPEDEYIKILAGDAYDKPSRIVTGTRAEGISKTIRETMESK